MLSKEGAKILIYHFMLSPMKRLPLILKINWPMRNLMKESCIWETLKTKLIDLRSFRVRALNCLKAAEVETLGDLVNSKKWPSEIPEFWKEIAYRARWASGIDESSFGRMLQIQTGKRLNLKILRRNHATFEKYKSFRKNESHRKACFRTWLPHWSFHKRSQQLSQGESSEDICWTAHNQTKVDSTHSRRVAFSYLKDKIGQYWIIPRCIHQKSWETGRYTGF